MDSHESEIEGIAMDHYQYYHYKAILSNEMYIAKIHASNPITVGFLISGGITNEPEGHANATDHESNPISECLTRHALLGKLALDEEIIESLNHTSEVGKMAATTSKTVNTFFGEELYFLLLAGGIILLAVLVIYGFFDQFIVRKFCCKSKRPGESTNNDAEIIQNAEFRADGNNEETIALAQSGSPLHQESPK